MLAFISLPALPGADSLIGLGEDILGGGDDEEVARETQQALQCEGGDVNVDLADKAYRRAQQDSNLRSLFSQYASTVNWAGGAPSSLREQVCGWSNHVHIGWPSPGNETYRLRQEIMQKVEAAPEVVGAGAPEGGGGDVGDQLLGLLDQIFRPGEIGDRAEGALEGGLAGAQTGARAPGVLSGALPWVLLGGLLLIGFVVLRRSS